MDEAGHYQHMLGISYFDEATDLHLAAVVRQSLEPVSGLSFQEFRKHFMKDWLGKGFPKPVTARYDGDGCFTSRAFVDYLESLMIKPEPIAGESAWQYGKHSRHIHTLKENMTSLAIQLKGEADVKELLARSVAAKNELHNIRGYSPNQWSFGRGGTQLGQYLRYENPVHDSARDEDQQFEQDLQRTALAKEVFIKNDARKRISRALNARSRKGNQCRRSRLLL